MPKYVAPNLRGLKFVWVPSRSGWLFVGTIGIGDLVQVVFIILIMCLNHVIKSDDHYPNAKSKWVKSKCYNIQVSWSSCGDLLKLYDGLQINWVEACYWIIMS
jgi:hypothetical protein